MTKDEQKTAVSRKLANYLCDELQNPSLVLLAIECLDVVRAVARKLSPRGAVHFLRVTGRAIAQYGDSLEQLLNTPPDAPNN